MADEREVFTILEDSSTGAGHGLHKRVEGDAVSGSKEHGVLPSKDSAGNFQHIPYRSAGDTASPGTPGLGYKNLAGNLQYANVRDEGQAPGDENVPALVAKDQSGNLQFLEVNASGELLVDITPGTPVDARGLVLATLASYVTVATLTLVASTAYSEIDAIGSSTFPVAWKLEQVDDMTTTIVAEGISGPGMFTVNFLPKNISRTAGASGTQQLKLSGKQLTGAASDLHGIVSALRA